MGHQNISRHGQQPEQESIWIFRGLVQPPVERQIFLCLCRRIYLKCNWGREYENVAVLFTMAVNEDGYRELIGAAEGIKENQASWQEYLRSLKQRGLTGT